MKYYLIAGEASGDLHGANLMKKLKEKDNSAQFRFFGGDLMKAQGGILVKHYRELAFMGFYEVLMNLRTILQNLKKCKEDILAFQPDAVIFIDYPGFNLRLAKFVKQLGFKVFYYISPQIWAWKESRIKIIQKYVDKMLVIFPFEKEYYKKFEYDVEFVGHPLLDALENNTKTSYVDFITANKLENKPIIALLPGSRKQEVKKILPVMLSIIDFFPNYQFVVATSTSLPSSFYAPYFVGKNCKQISGKTYELLQHSMAACVKSGTSTVETALLNTPEVVGYITTPISYIIGRMVLKIKFICMVNLIMDKLIVKELIQNEFNTENLKSELKKLLIDTEYREEMQQNFHELRKKLGGIGASERAAQIIFDYLN